MKLIPQLFMPLMVQQILAGNKTTTSRLPTCTNSLVNGERVSGKTWKEWDFDFSRAIYHAAPSIVGNPGPFLKVHPRMLGMEDTLQRVYPILNPAFYEDEGGLCLWVREGFAIMPDGDFVYRATWPDAAHVDDKEPKWKPGIHMPFSACRLFLKVTGFKAQRIQDITAEDAVAEGIEFYEKDNGWKDYRPGYGGSVWKKEFPVESFRSLWAVVHPGSWERNDWVWSPKFERVEKPDLKKT